MGTNKQPFSLEEWAGKSSFKKFLISGWGVAIICLVLMTPFALYSRHQPKEITTQISRITHNKLVDKHLIDGDYEASFLSTCEKDTLPNVNNDRQRMANACECEFESIAQIALTKNMTFAVVLGEIGAGRIKDQSCEFVN